MSDSSEARPRLVCRCLGVSSPRLFAAVRKGHLTTVAEVTKACRAGGGCGTCHPEIEEVLADVHSEPMPTAVRLENRLVCELETQVRVEGSLDSLIRPQLAARGVCIEEVEVQGLAVRVRLAGGDEEAATYIAEQLHKLVCSDFEVTVER